MTSRGARAAGPDRQPAALPVSPRVSIALLTFVAFALRMVRLAEPVLRWDEGWTIAHASLPWPELLAISAVEWHPPVYVALMKLWLALGAGALSVRYLSVLLGTLAVPVAYQLGRRWDGGRALTGVLAALLCAWLPLLVYYGQVARMYALATLAVLVAGLLLVRLLQAPHVRLGLVAGLAAASAFALLTQYYAAWPLAALYLYGLIVRPRRVLALVAAGLAALAAFAPWLVYAYPGLAARLATGSGRGISPLAGTLERLPVTLDGLLFYNGSSWAAPAALALVLVLGLGAGLARARRDEWRAELARLSLPALAVLIPLAGVSYGAQASGWAAPHRHMMLAAGLALLAVASALARLAAVARALPLAAFALLAIAYWPTSADYVYAKNLEVVDPFDPGIDQAYLHPRARADETVLFNVLARAGWYEHRRADGDPDWSYALSWEPIVEPIDVMGARVEAALARSPRLWFVMHEGAFGTNAPLVDWLDANLYPAGAEWRSEPPMTHTLYLSYVRPAGDWVEQRGPLVVGPSALASARWPEPIAPGGPVAVELRWASDGPLDGDYTLFVHWRDDAGAVAAQHDGVPVAGRRPTSGWQPGETLVDRHGARLPDGWRGRLHLVIGWYNPGTGAPIGEPVELAVFDVP
jgi:hypothetical protein